MQILQKSFHVIGLFYLIFYCIYFTFFRRFILNENRESDVFSNNSLKADLHVVLDVLWERANRTFNLNEEFHVCLIHYRFLSFTFSNWQGTTFSQLSCKLVRFAINDYPHHHDHHRHYMFLEDNGNGTNSQH